MGKLANLAAAVIMMAMGVTPAAAAKPAPPVVAVRVMNHTWVERVVMMRALSEVERIFARAGVQMEWLHAGDREMGLSLILILVDDPPPGVTIDDGGMGFAPTGAGGTTRVAYVLIHRVRRMSWRSDCDAGTVLAHVIAHELGHLLLPAGSHVDESIMQGALESRHVRARGGGSPFFHLGTRPPDARRDRALRNAGNSVARVPATRAGQRVSLDIRCRSSSCQLRTTDM